MADVPKTGMPYSELPEKEEFDENDEIFCLNEGYGERAKVSTFVDEVAGMGNADHMISDAFDEERDYTAGEYCIYDNSLYKFIEDKEAGEWDDNVVEITTVSGEIQENTDLIAGDSAGAHNAIYRGKSLGSSITTDQWNAIKAGTFNDMHIGDYWTINDVNWRIAAFDYYINTGSNYKCTDHHIVIVPDTILYESQMNTSNTTEGGYVGSAMYTSNLANAKTTVNSAFGSDHVLTHEEYFTNAITSGRPSGGEWADCTLEIMNEEMVYGCPIRQQMSYGGTGVYSGTIDKSQLPLFRYAPELQSILNAYWLRDIYSASYFCYVNGYGVALNGLASNSYGVRPAFAIYQS